MAYLSRHAQYYRKQYSSMTNTPVVKYSDPQNCGYDSQVANHLIGLVKAAAVPTSVSDLIKNLLISFSEQYNKYGHLSKKQWDLVHQYCIEQKGRMTPASNPLPGMPIPNGVNLIINRSAAFREFKYKFKLKYGIFAIKVLSIDQAGKARNGNTWANLTVEPDYDSPVSACRVCGKTLTDAKSIGSGIGPECAKNTGIWHIYKSGNSQQIKDAFKASVSAALQNKPVEIKLWTSQVKEGRAEFNNALDMYFSNIQYQINAIKRNAQVATVPSQPIAASTPVSNSIDVEDQFYRIIWDPKDGQIKYKDGKSDHLLTTLEDIKNMSTETPDASSFKWKQLRISNTRTGNIAKFALNISAEDHYLYACELLDGKIIQLTILR